MTQAQESVFANRGVNPLQYGEYSRSLQGTYKNPQGRKPRTMFEESLISPDGYRTRQWYAQPWKPNPELPVSVQHINEAATYSNQRPAKPCNQANRSNESFPVYEISAKAKLAYLRRKLKRRYFIKKPTAVVFQDTSMPSDDSLT
jgi:hypothetical protein